MASARYTLNITPDPPEEPPHKMTAKEKRENFWFYYKWHVVAAVILVFLAAYFIKDVMFKTEPDYTVGVLTDGGLQTGALEALEAALPQFFDDCNGDGRVIVQIQDYGLPVNTEDNLDPYTVMAGVTRLSGDLQGGICAMFLTDDAAAYSEQYGFMQKTDGTLADVEEKVDDEELGVLWGECPALDGILGTGVLYSGEEYSVDEYMADFRIVLRYVSEENLKKEDFAAMYAGTLAAYEAMTK